MFGPSQPSTASTTDGIFADNSISRGSVYYHPEPIADSELTLMRRIDELHLEHPFAGSRMLRDLLRLLGIEVGRRHVSSFGT